ncbi:hypothetical protein MQC88_05365 [Luteimonas sp. 50]|uniref:Uncharacterized protein n=1 Tax=Cognatiluteimonas sedimenti TaxID=2927791 RepID=A0ABT0A328_9GAMM|nr:hypothetical protein [Lysobacter sedimenti]MCJ0825388.1 hypothetical protein [Lysobacter sedimenti]
MTYQHGAFDQHAHASYVEAASALSPAMQGRLRAARRTALATPAGKRVQARRQRPSPLLPAGAVAAALLAVAVGLHWQPAGESSSPALVDLSAAQQASRADPDSVKRGTTPSDITGMPAAAPVEPSAASPAAGADAALAGVRSMEEQPLLMLDEDPDFYLWLGGDDALPANAEPSHDPT